MKSFTPKYSLGTYIFYPLAIGVAIWISNGALGSYQKRIIDLNTMIFLIGVSVVLLFWLYLFTKNRFTAIEIYEGELVLTNVIGAETRVKKEEIKNLTFLGIRTKNRILPISFYFMENNSKLYLRLEAWKAK